MCVCVQVSLGAEGVAMLGLVGFFFASLAGNLKEKLTLLRDSCVRMGLQQRVCECVLRCVRYGVCSTCIREQLLQVLRRTECLLI